MDAVALGLLALALGARHGLDADHVAVIDSLTRHNAGAPRLAAACGALFALGHGSVVLAVAAFGAVLGRAWSPPGWLEAVGAWTSIILLLTLGILNLRAGWASAEVVASAAPVGLRARLLRRMLRTQHPLGVVFIGAAFAVSLDTVSQALLLVGTAAAAGGTSLASAAAALFVVGMLLVDGAGGWWAWRLFRRGCSAADEVTKRLALIVGAMNIAMATLGMVRLHLVPKDWWNEQHDLALTAALVLLTTLAVVAANRWRRRDFRSPANEGNNHPAFRGDVQ